MMDSIEMMVTVLYKKYLRTTSYLVEEMECSNDSDSSIQRYNHSISKDKDDLYGDWY